jgi:hypothetical protein
VSSGAHRRAQAAQTLVDLRRGDPAVSEDHPRLPGPRGAVSGEGVEGHTRGGGALQLRLSSLREIYHRYCHDNGLTPLDLG